MVRRLDGIGIWLDRRLYRMVRRLDRRLYRMVRRLDRMDIGKGYDLVRCIYSLG